MTLKWGIASAGNISHDFVTAIGTLPTAEHQVVSIAARDLGRAKEFAKLHGIPKSYEGYENLAKDPNVDVVYVGVLNPQHFEVSMLMLQNGKNVLCEKPLCMNEKQAKELLSYAEEKQLFIMEAIWSRCFPSYQHLKTIIEAGSLGDIKEVTVEFGFKLEGIERLVKKSLGGGCVLDLGVYTIQIVQWIYQEAPKSITATGILNDEGCDVAMQAILKYSNGAIANIKTSALEPLSNTATIKGTKGEININNFWCPTTLIDVDGTEKNWPLPEAKHKFNFMNSCGLRYEAEEVRKCIMGKQLQSKLVSHNESLMIARIEDEIRKQIGVHYPADD